jgi:hypothetical protein
MACRYCQTTQVWRAWRKGIGEQPTFYASQRRTGSNLADLGRRRCAPASLITEAGELPDMSAGLRGGRGDVLRGSHGDVAGVESDASSAERSTSEHGNHPWLPGPPRPATCARGWAHRRPTGRGWDGAAVVVAGSRPAMGPGEPVTGRRAAVVSRSAEKGLEAVMPNDAPPNGDAPSNDDQAGEVPVGSRRRVSEMQAKLHRWAVADPGRLIYVQCVRLNVRRRHPASTRSRCGGPGEARIQLALGRKGLHPARRSISVISYVCRALGSLFLLARGSRAPLAWGRRPGWRLHVDGRRSSAVR